MKNREGLLRRQLPPNRKYDHPFPFLSCWFTVICGFRPCEGNMTVASLRTMQLIYQTFSLRPVEIRQRKKDMIVYDSWTAATETVNLFGCAGQQSDNGWRGLLEPAIPLGFVNAVRGGWRGSSAFISTFRDTHSRWLVDSTNLSLFFFCSLIVLDSTVNFLLCLTVYLCVPHLFSRLFSLSLSLCHYSSPFSPWFLMGFEQIHLLLF